MSTIIDRRPSKSTQSPRPVRRSAFGAGLGERCPVHRAPAGLDDMAWWATQNETPAGFEVDADQDEELMLREMFEEFRAQDRLSAGLEPY